MTSQWIKRLNKNSLNKYSAVIFDLSGVLVDFGMHIPVIATSRAFNNYNIHISEKNIRKHNFKTQEQYIKAMCNFNNCSNKFESIYTDYLNELVILHNSPDFNQPINGAQYTTNILKKLGYKIGITTFYNRNVFNVIDKTLKQNGIIYDEVVCNNDVLLGKPEPFMLFRMSSKLDTPINKCIKVGESYFNVIEGKYAKMDTINVIDSSNDMGVDEQIFDDSCEIIKNVKRMEVIDNLMNFPLPKYFVPSVADIGNVLKNKL
jgi:phosphonoacetaldehyde hydrolase